MKRFLLPVLVLIGGVAVAKPVVWYHFNEKPVGESTANNAVNAPDILNAADTVNGGHELAAYARTFNNAYYSGGSLAGGVPDYDEAMTHGVTWTDGSDGAAATDLRCLRLFDKGVGVRGGVVLKGDDRLHLASFTAELFLRWRTDIGLQSSSVRLLCLHNGKGTAAAWEVMLDQSGKKIKFCQNARAEPIPFTDCPMLFDGSWHHLALTYSGETRQIRLYVDYGLCASADDVTITYASDVAYDILTIGRGDAENWGFHEGWIDEFRLSDTVLAPEDFLQLKRPFGDEDVLAYIPCDDLTLKTAQVRGPNVQAVRLAAMTDGQLMALESEDLPGTSLRGNLFASAGYENGNAYLFATNAETRSACIVLSDAKDGRHTLLDHDAVTIELQFKADPIDTARETTYRFQTLVAIHTADGTSRTYIRGHAGDGPNDHKLQSRFLKEGGGYVDGWGSPSMRDGKWHHLALVFERAAGRVLEYLDGVYLCGWTNATVLASAKSDSCIYIGGSDLASDGFCGRIDNVRITKRALLPRELLSVKSAPAAPSPTKLYMSFDGSLKNEVLPDEPAGATEGTWSYSERVPGHVVERKAAMGFDVNNASSLSISSGGAVRFANPIAIEGLQTQTVEFYVKLKSDVPAWTPFVRYDCQGQDGALAGQDVVAVWNFTMNGVKNLVVRMDTTDRFNQDLSFDTPTLADGRWHHVAATFERKVVGDAPMTEVHAYLDGEEALPKSGAGMITGEMLYRTGYLSGVLQLGKNLNGTPRFNGSIDELRVSEGLLDPSAFLRASHPDGLMLIFR